MKSISIWMVALMLSANAFCQDMTYYNTNGIAINGYDPVAFFKESKAVKGTADYSFDWSGSKWLFTSQANLDSFKTRPMAYAPQYGGYCAYGCSEKHKSPTDQNAWTIVGDKLYFNYNNKVKEYWMKDTSGKIKAADAYWQSLKN